VNCQTVCYDNSMINKEEWRIFEDEIIRQDDLSIEQKFKILESMYAEAVALGIMPYDEPLDGIDVDIRIAKAINSVSKAA